MKVDIGEVLARSWQITWKNKVLWLYGGLLTLVSFLFLPLMLAPMIADLTLDQTGDDALFLLLFIGAGILFFLIIYPVGALMQAALTLGILRAEGGEEEISFMESIRESYPFFWRYLGTMTLFVGGMFLVLILLSTVMTLLSIVTFGLGMLCMFPFFFLQYPLMLVWYVCMEQSLTAVVADSMGVMDAIRHSWQLFKNNIWIFVIVGLVIYFGISMISSMVMMPFMFPFFFLPFALESAEIGRIVLVLTGLFMVLFVPLFSIFQGAVMTFMKSGWILTYIRLTRPSNGPVTVDATI